MTLFAAGLCTGLAVGLVIAYFVYSHYSKIAQALQAGQQAASTLKKVL